jgi:hypothetical protein
MSNPDKLTASLEGELNKMKTHGNKKSEYPNNFILIIMPRWLQEINGGLRDVKVSQFALWFISE